MTAIVPVEYSQNRYAQNKSMMLVEEKIVPFQGRKINKLTYQDSHCVLWKVSQIVLALILTIVTLGFVLCCAKGRHLWTKGIETFKNHVIYVNAAKQLDTGSQTQIDAILKDQPEWSAQVKTWSAQGISLSDQLWLLRVFELKLYEVNLPPLEKIMNGKEVQTLVPQQISSILSNKQEIEKSFLDVKRIVMVSPLPKFYKFPETISWLKNLETLDLDINHLVILPDLSHNVKLKELFIMNSKLVALPDISKNIALLTLSITDGCLKVFPDVTQNTKLENIKLNNNKLTGNFDLSGCRNLETIDISENQLEITPSFLFNVELVRINLSHNSLKTPINLGSNADLAYLDLSFNQFKQAPDLSKNADLAHLDLSFNEFEQAGAKTLHC